MTVLVDGYNVLHAVGVLSGRAGPGQLERARQGLLALIASALDADERRQVVVVFDAHDAPPGLPREQTYREIQVRFAAGFADADELLVELIRTDSTPKQLLVVSSDQQIKLAALRRRAQSVESETWYDQLVARRDAAPPPPKRRPAKPASETPTSATNGCGGSPPTCPTTTTTIPFRRGLATSCRRDLPSRARALSIGTGILVHCGLRAASVA